MNQLKLTGSAVQDVCEVFSYTEAGNETLSMLLVSMLVFANTKVQSEDKRDLIACRAQ